MRRSWLRRKPGKPLRRTKLRVKGHSETSEIRERIQALLREIVIIRDGGCVLRKYPEAGACGGWRNDGQLILQAEHLITRSNGATFGDTRNVICLCRNHHGFFKPQYGYLYWKLIERHLGPTRWAWFQLAEADKSPHRMDWKLVEMGLMQELKSIMKK